MIIIIIILVSRLELAATATAVQASNLSDPEITAIAVMANQININARQPDIIDNNQQIICSSKLMTADLMAVVKKATTTLVMKHKISPEGDAPCTRIKIGGERNIKHLKDPAGATYDRTYINNEIICYQSVIDAMSNMLTQNADYEKLGPLLISTHPAFLAPLEQVKQRQNMPG